MQPAQPTPQQTRLKQKKSQYSAIPYISDIYLGFTPGVFSTILSYFPRKPPQPASGASSTYKTKKHNYNHKKNTRCNGNLPDVCRGNTCTIPLLRHHVLSTKSTTQSSSNGSKKTRPAGVSFKAEMKHCPTSPPIARRGLPLRVQHLHGYIAARTDRWQEIQHTEIKLLRRPIDWGGVGHTHTHGSISRDVTKLIPTIVYDTGTKKIS